MTPAQTPPARTVLLTGASGFIGRSIAVADACATGCAASVRNRLPNTATPTTWPSWNVVVTRPLASAADAGGTLTSVCVISGPNAVPMPTPKSSSVAAITTLEFSWCANAIAVTR